MGVSVISVVIALLAVVSSASSTAPWQAKPKVDVISGEWDTVLTSQDNTAQITLKLKLEGAKVTGTSESSHLGDGAISNGSWANNMLKITVDTRHGPLALTGSLRNGKLIGDWDMGNMQGKWEAKKKTPEAKGAKEATSANQNGVVNEIDSPAGAGSGDPNLSVGPDGRVFLSWLDPIRLKGYALKFAVRSRGDAWSKPRTITQGETRFDSSILALPDGSLSAHWLTKSGPGMHANDVNLSISRDGGRTWGEAIVPHQDRTPAARGFVSMIPANGGIAIVWLNGRKMTGGDPGAAGHGSAEKARAGASQHTGGADHQHTGGDHRAAGHGPTASEMGMSLMYRMIGMDGTLGKEVLLDDRVCECCQTSAAPTLDGMAVVYRDRSEREVRDISIVRLKNGQWSEPQPLSKDGWEIQGCPVNGPAISSAGQNLAVAWFTAAKDQPRVYAALSSDGGATFGPPILVGDENPIGRVDVIALPSGNALVSWVDRMPDGPEVRARVVRPDGSKAPAIVVAETSSGVPRMKMSGDEVIIAWTDSRNIIRVHTATLRMTGN
ncbi:MAG TPA: sialidase family protein [Blastocatellia bacterium]|nr:sialidase family protein [Blastocatellia bacterium]